MTAEERVSALHARMEEMERVRERRKTRITGTACVLIALCLPVLIFGGAPQTGGTAGMFSGALMLFGDVGGYVLVAVAAFMTGAVITAVILKRRNRKQQNENEHTFREEQNEET
ncbi:MAG: hypothetical protein J6Z23_01255 [Lachnospiraceae bacterium]|nr:hypothetical protein [Lachnospiraceae bacterium]